MATEKKTTPARPTMKMIADELGISRQLVSIVMREQPGASDETQQKVKEAARQMGYYHRLPQSRLSEAKEPAA